MAQAQTQHDIAPFDLVVTLLLERGYGLVARDLRIGRIHVDLVVTDGPQTVFVVVKTLRGRGFGGAIELVTPRRAQGLVRAVSRYLSDHPSVPSVRIDVVAASLGRAGSWKLEHYVNAVP